MRVAAVSSAFPPHVARQPDVLAEILRSWSAHPSIVRRAEGIFANSGVETRRFAMPVPEYSQSRAFGARNDAWIESALELGETAIRSALQRAGLAACDVGVIVFTTVTGLATPSIEARLVHRVGLSPRIHRVPLFGLGCVAGAAALARTAELAATAPGPAAILLSVELCSLTFQREDVSLSNLVAAALFGDGAAAVVLTGDDAGSRRGPRIVATRSVLYPESERVMGWDVSERGFQLVLSPDVADVVGRHVREDVDSFLADHGLSRADVARWILHPGGPKILQAVVDALELAEPDVRLTRESLRRFGNLSSSSVLLVLKETMEEHPPPAGSHAVMLAMGPGFCSELLLLRWDA